MLNKYVVRPNMGPGVGVDSNNFLDVRKHRHGQDQGTFRLDRIFSGGDIVYGRYSASKERGFMPQNLPGFGAFHDNMSQHVIVAWNHIISSTAVNTASFAVSRLAMHRSSENNESNDIVSELGIEGVGFGGKGAYGAPWFAVQGYSGFGDSFAATPAKEWDGLYEGRDTISWQRGRHGLKFGVSYRHYIWPMWGFFQNRGFYHVSSPAMKVRPRSRCTCRTENRLAATTLPVRRCGSPWSVRLNSPPLV